MANLYEVAIQNEKGRWVVQDEKALIVIADSDEIAFRKCKGGEYAYITDTCYTSRYFIPTGVHNPARIELERRAKVGIVHEPLTIHDETIVYILSALEIRIGTLEKYVEKYPKAERKAEHLEKYKKALLNVREAFNLD